MKSKCCANGFSVPYWPRSYFSHSLFYSTRPSIITFLVWLKNRFSWFFQRCKSIKCWIQENRFHLFLHLRLLPFDWKTPFGYLLAWLNQFLGASAGFLSITPLYSLIFASSWLFITLADDLRQELVTFNVIVKISNGNDHDEIVQRFFNVIRLYTDVRE